MAKRKQNAAAVAIGRLGELKGGTARAVLTTMPLGQLADAQFVKWLMERKNEVGVLATVLGLVDKINDHPFAEMTVQEIAQRVQQSQQQQTAASKTPPTTPPNE
jgi:hypothetical protein